MAKKNNTEQCYTGVVKAQNNRTYVVEIDEIEVSAHLTKDARQRKVQPRIGDSVRVTKFKTHYQIKSINRVSKKRKKYAS